MTGVSTGTRGLDDTPLSERLVAYAVAFARAFDAPVALLLAYAWSERTAMVEAPMIEVLADGRSKEEDAARSQLDHFARSLRAQGLTLEEVVLDDTAVDAIRQESRRVPETQVVLGSHDHGWLSRLMRGNTSHEVLSRFETPTLIVPVQR